MDTTRRQLLLLTVALMTLGVVMVYSASFVAAERKFGVGTFFFQRHCMYLLAGVAALVVGARCDYHRLARHWRWLLGGAFLLLAVVLIPGIGEKLNGARRWLRLGPVSIQPSEIAKPLLIAGLSAWVVTRRDAIGSFKQGFLPGMALAGGAVLLTALEPDLGTAALLLAVLGAILLAGGVRFKYALPALLIALPVGLLCAWSRLGYIQRRIEEFLCGTPDVLGKGYQVTEGLIAQGSGGLFGAGIGLGNAKLLFLPEAHNDFVFAVIGEELGLLGSLGVVACFALFVWTGWRIARNAPDRLGGLMALGITLLVGLQAAMNIAVVTRSMPTKGISLPLVSYGGSGLVFTLFAIGLLLNVAGHAPAGHTADAAGEPASSVGDERPEEGRAAVGVEPVVVGAGAQSQPTI